MNKSKVLDLDWLREQGAEPQWFGLGFIQLKLNTNNRMHFYPKEMKAFVDPEEVHDHRYDFESEILQGNLVQEFFDFQAGKGDYEIANVSCDANNPAPDIEPVGGKIIKTGSVCLKAGDSYWIEADTFHRVEGCENAITMLNRGRVSKQFARVIRLKGAEKVCAFSRPMPTGELWEIIESMLPRGPGYHLKPITKGILGEASKVLEEAHEFADAVDQNVSIMALVELADLVGAAEAYLAKHHPSMTLEDLKAMSAVTQRAFKNGRR